MIMYVFAFWNYINIFMVAKVVLFNRKLVLVKVY